MKKTNDKVQIAKRIRGILISVILLALIVSLLIVFPAQIYVERTYVYQLLETYVEDLYKDSIEAYKNPVHNETGYAQTEGGGSNSQYSEPMNYWFMNVVKNRRVGVIGALVIVTADEKKIIGSTDSIYIGEYMDMTGVFSDRPGEFTRSEPEILGEPCYAVSVLVGDHYLLGIYPKEEAGWMSVFSTVLMTGIFAIILLCMFFVLRKLLKKYVVDGIYAINSSLMKITEGDLEEKADVRTSTEFASLSDGINVTVDRLKMLIAKANAKIDEELETARMVQKISLPDPEKFCSSRRDFGLYACMETAKMVGGDFYDFYMLSDHLLAVTIADVSDKGIAAALFMMRAKALLQDLAKSGMGIAELMTQANRSLWENNEGNMFVTVWIGFIDLSNGNVSYVHAGHTCPVLIRHDGPVFVKKKQELLMGGMPGVVYHEQKIVMHPGEQLFLYTDGVNEASDGTGEQYGNQRLLSVLSSAGRCDGETDLRECCKRTCRLVSEDVKRFSDGAIQSDDITMLCIAYNK